MTIVLFSQENITCINLCATFEALLVDFQRSAIDLKKTVNYYVKCQKKRLND